MQNIQFPLTLSTYFYDMENSIPDMLNSSRVQNISLNISTRMEPIDDPDEFEDARVAFYTFNSARDLREFLNYSIYYITCITTAHGADDDYFDNIPMFFEEYYRLLEQLRELYPSIPQESWDDESLKNSITLCIEFLNNLIANHQDTNEDCDNINYWFGSEFKAIPSSGKTCRCLV